MNSNVSYGGSGCGGRTYQQPMEMRWAQYQLMKGGCCLLLWLGVLQDYDSSRDTPQPSAYAQKYLALLLYQTMR